MATRNQILNNIREYSASEIADAIRGGEISLYELSKSGNLSPLLRKRIEEQLNTVSENVLTDQDADVNDLPQCSESINDINDESATTEDTIEEECPTVISSEMYSDKTDLSSIEENESLIKKMFSFKGRMRRLHYGLSIIAFYLVLILVFVIGDALRYSTGNSTAFIIPGIVIIFFAFWFVLAARIKRCHDRGKSGWWLLYTCIPYVGAVFDLILLFDSGDEDENAYGPNPKN